ncbi:MAG: hypothetical protein HRT71_13090 [Flavobacteriales bacterium]|nr:hypothetical protein [Flavobacteriales bacterium]
MKRTFLLTALIFGLTISMQSQTQPPTNTSYQPSRDAGRKIVKDTTVNEIVDGKYKTIIDSTPTPATPTTNTLQQSTASETKHVFCRIVGSAKLFSSKVNVAIDYGAGHSIWKDNRLKNSQGKAVTFNSMVDALNYLGQDGWALAQAYTITVGNTSVYHYLMTKVMD